MEKIWTVYILECGDGTLYTGITDDLERRLRAHETGKGAKYTRGRGPLKLRYRESVPDKGAALRRELEIKRLRKCEKLDIINKNVLQNQKDLKNMYKWDILASEESSVDICRKEDA